MTKISSFFKAVFTTKISPILSFGMVCFLGISMSSLIMFSYSDPSLLVPGIQTANADIIKHPIEIAQQLEPVNTEKEIFVSLKDQTLIYMEGPKVIGEFNISSGLARTPTPPGEYTVLKKKPLVNYRGAGYNYPRTKWNLMFKAGNPLNYYIHGAFWHNNFGHPMSHGCVNVAYSDMETLYNWAEEGTKIIIQESFDSLPDTLTHIYPKTPTSIRTDKVSDTSVAITWDAATDPVGVAGYRVFVNNRLVSTTSDLKYEVSGLNPNTTYQFAVSAYNQYGSRSGWSEGLKVATSENLGVISGSSTSFASTHIVTVDSLGNISPADLTIQVNDTVNFIYPNPAQEMVLVFNEHEFILRSHKFTSGGMYTYKVKDYNGNSATITVNQ